MYWQLLVKRAMLFVCIVTFWSDLLATSISYTCSGCSSATCLGKHILCPGQDMRQEIELLQNHVKKKLKKYLLTTNRQCCMPRTRIPKDIRLQGKWKFSKGHEVQCAGAHRRRNESNLNTARKRDAVIHGESKQFSPIWIRFSHTRTPSTLQREGGGYREN